MNICPLLVTFDWRVEGNRPVADITNGVKQFQAADDAAWAAMARDFPRVRLSDRDDVIADQQRFGLVVSPLMQKFANRCVDAGCHEIVMKAALKDLEGEAPMLRAAVMLLNSRNLATTAWKPAPAKLNKARVARGKRPLLDYTHVGIKLTRALAARAGAAHKIRAIPQGCTWSGGISRSGARGCSGGRRSRVARASRRSTRRGRWGCETHA